MEQAVLVVQSKGIKSIKMEKTDYQESTVTNDYILTSRSTPMETKANGHIILVRKDEQ